MSSIKKEKTFRSKILTIVGTILCILLLPILIVNVILITKSYFNENEVPSIGNIICLVVLTDSMYPEIENGDLIILNKIESKDIKVGDIISYFDPSGNGTTVVTHRVVEIITEDGKINFKTKGDGNNIEDKFLVPSDKVIGIYKSKIHGVGNIAMFMATTKGLVVCVIVPLIMLIGYDVITRKRYDKKNKAEKEALLEELESLRKESANKKNRKES